MTRPICDAWADVTHPVIGMVHLRPLPGAPRFAGDLAAVIDAALADAEAWQQAGAHGLMVENFGDAPFHKSEAPCVTVASITAVASAVRDAVGLPLGINVLRNDAESAIAVAAAVGASYVRVNVLSGAAVTDQGVIEGRAAEVMRLRASLRAEHVKVLADVRVKHAAPLVERPLAEEVEELVLRAGADAVIVSGGGTGKPTDPAHAGEVRQYTQGRPVLIGSGADAKNIPQLKPNCDGFIIGTAAKPGGRIDAAVDAVIARSLIEVVQ